MRPFNVSYRSLLTPVSYLHSAVRQIYEKNEFGDTKTVVKYVSCPVFTITASDP